MFTIKYVMTDGNEMIDGPFVSVMGGRVDREGHPAPRNFIPHAWMVTARYASNSGSFADTATYGPIFRDGPDPEPIAFLYVMNESGATVAKYEL